MYSVTVYFQFANMQTVNIIQIANILNTGPVDQMKNKEFMVCTCQQFQMFEQRKIIKQNI